MQARAPPQGAELVGSEVIPYASRACAVLLEKRLEEAQPNRKAGTRIKQEDVPGES